MEKRVYISQRHFLAIAEFCPQIKIKSKPTTVVGLIDQLVDSYKNNIRTKRVKLSDKRDVGVLIGQLIIIKFSKPLGGEASKRSDLTITGGFAILYAWKQLLFQKI